MDRLRERLRHGGRPIVVGPSPEEVYPEQDFGDAVRRGSPTLVAFQRAIAEAGADVLLAPTASTTALALQRSGQGYRAAALTGVAIDMSRDGATEGGKSPWIVGVVVASASSRARDEAKLHVDRLINAGVAGILLRVDDPSAAIALAPALAASGVPTFVEGPPPIDDAVLAAFPHAVFVVRDRDPEAIARAIEHVRGRSHARVGARVELEGNDVDAVVSRVKSLISSLDLALLGVAGPGALAALPALVTST